MKAKTGHPCSPTGYTSPSTSPSQTTTIRVDARIAPGTTGLLLVLTVNNTTNETHIDRAVVVNNDSLKDRSPDAAISASIRYEGDEHFSDFPVTFPGVLRDDNPKSDAAGVAGEQSAVQKDDK